MGGIDAFLKKNYTQADRLMLVKQPVSRIDSGSFESGSEGFSKQLEAFFAA